MMVMFWLNLTPSNWWLSHLWFQTLLWLTNDVFLEFYEPACFRDDHLRAGFVELLPQLPLMQNHLYVLNVLLGTNKQTKLSERTQSHPSLLWKSGTNTNTPQSNTQNCFWCFVPWKFNSQFRNLSSHPGMISEYLMGIKKQLQGETVKFSGSVCTWSGSLELGMLGALDRPSRDWSGIRSVSLLPPPPPFIQSSVTAGTFSCSISEESHKHSAVTEKCRLVWDRTNHTLIHPVATVALVVNLTKFLYPQQLFTEITKCLVLELNISQVHYFKKILLAKNTEVPKTTHQWKIKTFHESNKYDPRLEIFYKAYQTNH